MSFRNSLLIKYASAFTWILVWVLLTACAQQPKPNSRLEHARNVLQHSHEQLIQDQPLKDSAQSTDKKNLDALYAQLLSPQSALTIFFAQSPKVQEAVSQLKETDAQVVQAGLLSNPHLSLSLLKSPDTHHWLWDASLLQPLFDVFARKDRQHLAEIEAQLTELEVLDQLHQLIAEFRKNYFQAMHAQQSLTIAQNQLNASDACASLAHALYRAGNISELEYLGHLTEFQNNQLSFSNQSFEQSQAHAHLALWLASERNFNILTEFPLIPIKQWDPQQLKILAIKNNLDLQILHFKQNLLDNQLSLVRKEYGLGNFEFGIAAKQEADGSKALGVAADLPLNLFDQGKAKLKVLYANTQTLVARTHSTQLNINFEIDQSLKKMRLAQSTLLLIEQSKSTAERRLALAQQEMNFMLKSPFELIDLKFQYLNIDQARISAQLNYWDAYTQLENILGVSLDQYSDDQNNSTEQKNAEKLP